MLTKDEISFRGTTFVPAFRFGKQTLIMIKTRKQPSKKRLLPGLSAASPILCKGQVFFYSSSSSFLLNFQQIYFISRQGKCQYFSFSFD